MMFRKLKKQLVRHAQLEAIEEAFYEIVEVTIKEKETWNMVLKISRIIEKYSQEWGL